MHSYLCMYADLYYLLFALSPQKGNKRDNIVALIAQKKTATLT